MPTARPLWSLPEVLGCRCGSYLSRGTNLSCSRLQDENTTHLINLINISIAFISTTFICKYIYTPEYIQKFLHTYIHTYMDDIEIERQRQRQRQSSAALKDQPKPFSFLYPFYDFPFISLSLSLTHLFSHHYCSYSATATAFKAATTPRWPSCVATSSAVEPGKGTHGVLLARPCVCCVFGVRGVVKEREREI